MTRQATRVLLVDPQERLLLLRFRSPDTGAPFWAPVGGGIEPGETVAEAARREVREETGLADLVLGPECFVRDVSFTWHGRRVEQQERWFVAYVDAFEVSIEGWTDDEREDITEVRWFSLADLEACDEALVPLDLARVYATLLLDGPPESPVPLGF